MYKIYIVEDDRPLRGTVKQALERFGYEVYVTDDFENVDKAFLRIKPDLTLLDINLPYYDGFILCKILRQLSNAPIIIMSARNSDIEQVHGIELGADEYIVKPFSLDILLAKVKALLRRSYEHTQVNTAIPTVIKGLSLDKERFRLSFGESAIEISKNELLLLTAFIENPDQVLTREDLMSRLWDSDTFIDENTLNVNIKRVKDRLLDLGLEDCIRAKRGVGYIFNSEVIEHEHTKTNA
ncbi:response regulator transcription factor [Vallitalea okinawensis]|uniref:response regulator transcription factor n=1 Tax=Vallitalea okinawensis TaxID=2078660 RepID=UPI0014791DF1|nr:response regulator transcription factor [Vallitalea okinawensis]